MPSRANATQLKQLQRRVNQLANKEKALTEARQSLIQKQQLLAALCDTFATVQASAVGPGLGFNPCRSILEELSLAEGVLLSCLGVGSKSAVAPASAAAAQHRDLGVTTVAPRDDPLALFKQLLSLPPLPDAGTVTPLELGKMYRQTLLQASIELHLVQSEAPSLLAQGRQRLEQLWQGQLRHHLALVLSGRPQVVEELNLYNCNTMTFETDAAAKHAAQVAAMPPQLGLTEQQLQEISTGMSLFMHLYNNIMEQQQVLHAELNLSVESHVDSSNSGSASSHSGSLASTALGDVECLQHELEGRQRSTSRMQVLLHKEYLMRGAAAAWFVGCLDWQQLTKAPVMSWPYPLRSTLLVQHISQYAQEQGHAPQGSDSHGHTDGAAKQCSC